MRMALIAVSSLLASTAFAQAQPPPQPQPQPQAQPQSNTGNNGVGSELSTGDRQFVNDAAQTNLAAIKLGQLGVQKGSSAELRNLAQMVVDDHKNLGDRLQLIASMRKNVKLPTEPNPQQRATYDRLSALSGSDFDRAFLDELKTAQGRAITLFQVEAQSGVDPQLKIFAQSTLPSLRQNQQMVDRRANNM
jgi:putative membrane protein